MFNVFRSLVIWLENFFISSSYLLLFVDVFFFSLGSLIKKIKIEKTNEENCWMLCELNMILTRAVLLVTAG